MSILHVTHIRNNHVICYVDNCDGTKLAYYKKCKSDVKAEKTHNVLIVALGRKIGNWYCASATL